MINYCLEVWVKRKIGLMHLKLKYFSNWLGKSGFGTLFGKGTRGLTMGVWNTHQYVGNIIGLSVAASYADEVR